MNVKHRVGCVISSNPEIWDSIDVGAVEGRMDAWGGTYLDSAPAQSLVKDGLSVTEKINRSSALP